MSNKFVEIVTDVMDNFRNRIESSEDLNFRALQNFRDSLEDMKEADMYFISEDFKEALAAYHNELVEEEENSRHVVFSEDCRLPSKLCFISMDTFDTKDVVTGEVVRAFGSGHIDGFLCRQSEDGSVAIRLVARNSVPTHIGSYELKRGGIRFPTELHERLENDESFHAMYLEMITTISGAFSLINQPRFVDVLKSGSRQQRKKAQKQHGVDVEQWHEISWNVNEPIEGEVDDRGRSFHMPLHYTRGHWRKAKPHWDDVVYRQDGLPYIWIDGFWSGHPAYGIKKGYHAPKLGKAA
jgi:hypothetical protein